MSVDAQNINHLHSSASAEQRRARFSERRMRIGSTHSPIAALLHRVMSPTVAVGSLFLLMALVGQPLDSEHTALAVLVFLISSQLLTPAVPRKGRRLSSWLAAFVPRLAFEWLCLIGVLLFLGFAFKVSAFFSRFLLLTWCFLTPALLIVTESFKARIAQALAGPNAKILKHVVIGANELGLELTRRANITCGSTLAGYFDDRSSERLPAECHPHLRGTSADVVRFVQAHGIDAIYIALPLSSAPRMANLLNELRDTTASIYFVPDILSFDIIQARFVEMDGLPVLSLCDTPFNGTSALLKRGMDVAFATAALLTIWPLMLAIAIGVKLSSPGPVFFKQRRYGLNGEEILVYKFRSMTACEDSHRVIQAKRNDQRITSFGRYLRRTSLDELPQIVNVLQGRMSIVGPRPHAVAHNEQYRKVINGYMIRHKVRPGITGWAQVNGMRGETETLDKMRQRVEYDLDYLRRWSVWMDIKIVLKTIKLVLHDSHAY